MNKLKLSLGILLIFILGALAGSLGTGLYVKHRIGAFVRGGPPPLMHLLMRKMSHQLDLTKEQEAKIKKIMEQAHQDISAFRERYHPEFEKIIDESFVAIREMLDEGQKIKLDALQEELKKRPGRMGPPGMPGPPHRYKPRTQPLADLKERLNLTEEQAVKIEPILEEDVKKRRNVIRQQKRQGLRWEEGSGRDALRLIQEDTEQKLTAILTENQMEEYRRMECERPPRMIPEKPGSDPFERP